MTQPAKAQEPSMEEILASIRRIIADDDATTKTPPKAAEPMPPSPLPPLPTPPPRPAAVSLPPRPDPPPPPAPAMRPAVKPVEIDAMLADLNAAPAPPALERPAPDVLDLTEAMAAPVPPPEGFRTIDGQADIVFEDSPVESEPQPEAAIYDVHPQFQDGG